MRSLLFAVLLGGCGDPAIAFDPRAGWPAPEDLDLDGTTIWAVNGGEDTVSVLGLSPLEERARFPVGIVPVELEGPAELEASPSGRVFLSVTNDPPEDGSGPHADHAARLSDDGQTLAIDRTDASLAGRARVDPMPGDLAVLSDGSVLQAHFDLGLAIRVLHQERPLEEADTRLEVIDGESMAIRRRVPVCPAPVDIALSADEHEAYLACYGSDEVSIVSLEGDDSEEVVRVSLGPLARFAHPYYSPRALAVSPVDGKVWVSCWMEEAGSTAKGELFVFDPEARTFEDLPDAQFDGNPMQGVFDASGARFFVPYRLSDRLEVIDTASGELLVERDFTPDECLRAHVAILSADETTLHLLCEGDHVGPGKVLALDAETLETVGEVAVGVWPTDLALLP